MLGFVAVNPFMANDSVFSGPISHWVGLFLPMLPVALVLHFGTTRGMSVQPVRYVFKVVLGSVVATALALLLLAILIFAITGEFT